MKTHKGKRRFTHLTLKKRERLATLRAEGYTVTECAKKLRVDKSTVSRELRRTPVLTVQGDVYVPLHSQYSYEGKRKECRPKIKMNDPTFRKEIVLMIQAGLSPETIEGVLKKNKRRSVSHETLYEWIYASEIGIQEMLYEYLVRGQKKRRKQTGRSKQNHRLEGRVFIEARSKACRERTEYGHYESDSVQCQKKTINTLVERKTRQVTITKLPTRDAASTRDALITRLTGTHVRSITSDNGPENAQHASIAQTLGIRFFFCHPYHSWEKGTNENRNGVIRRSLPRSENLDDWSQEELDEIAEAINTTPMKCLGYLTPNEAVAIEEAKLFTLSKRCIRN